MEGQGSPTLVEGWPLTGPGNLEAYCLQASTTLHEEEAGWRAGHVRQAGVGPASELALEAAERYQHLLSRRLLLSIVILNRSR